MSSPASLPPNKLRSGFFPPTAGVCPPPTSTLLLRSCLTGEQGRRATLGGKSSASMSGAAVPGAHEGYSHLLHTRSHTHHTLREPPPLGIPFTPGGVAFVLAGCASSQAQRPPLLMSAVDAAAPWQPHTRHPGRAGVTHSPSSRPSQRNGGRASWSAEAPGRRSAGGTLRRPCGPGSLGGETRRRR